MTNSKYDICIYELTLIKVLTCEAFYITCKNSKCAKKRQTIKMKLKLHKYQKQETEGGN